MTDYLERTRTALRNLLGGRPLDEGGDSADGVPLGEHLVLVNGRVRFVDPVDAASKPSLWLDAFEAAIAHDAVVADDALSAIGSTVRAESPGWLATGGAPQRLLAFLRPRPGLAMRLAEMRDCGWLGQMFPYFQLPPGGRVAPGPRSLDSHPLVAVQALEALFSEASLSGERFGSMLRELEAPELLVVALLLHHAGPSKYEHKPDQALALAQPSLDALQLTSETRRLVEFLIRNQLQMSQTAFRQDIADTEVVGRFAALLRPVASVDTFSPEEHLKLLCLLTVADLGAIGPEALTPWKAELLWRLFVDTYNHLTMAYGDDVIDEDSGARAALHATRPDDISDAELTHFLEGLPTRYLTLFAPGSIYQHVRLWRAVGGEDTHYLLTRKRDLWELTVVTVDKPYLFSDICGVLSYLGLDIVRGQALTSRSAVVVDVLQFSDQAGLLAQSSLDPLLSDVLAGRVDITARLVEKERLVPAEAVATAPVLYFDNDCSARYTVLELVVADAPGLLHRISRRISGFGCEVDLVLIATEGGKMNDIFHLRKDGVKLSDADELELADELERLLDDGSA
jgi:[protein-PII] uridylyltransferase